MRAGKVDAAADDDVAAAVATDVDVVGLGVGAGAARALRAVYVTAGECVAGLAAGLVEEDLAVVASERPEAVRDGAAASQC